MGSVMGPDPLTPPPFPPQTDAASLFVGLNEERLVVGGAAESMGRSGAAPPLLDLRLPHSADTERCRARFHRAARVGAPPHSCPIAAP